MSHSQFFIPADVPSSKEPSEKKGSLIEIYNQMTSQKGFPLTKFYAFLYQAEEFRPYWNKIMEAAKQDQMSEGLEFLVDYVELKKSTTRAAWEELYKKWFVNIIRLNLDFGAREVINDINEKIKEMIKDPNEVFDLKQITVKPRKDLHARHFRQHDADFIIAAVTEELQNHGWTEKSARFLPILKDPSLAKEEKAAVSSKKEEKEKKKEEKAAKKKEEKGEKKEGGFLSLGKKR